MDNLYCSDHKSTNDDYREGYDRTFRPQNRFKRILRYLYRIFTRSLIVGIFTLAIMQIGCVPTSYYGLSATVRHYKNNYYDGKSEIYKSGDSITIRTYDRQGRLKSTSRGYLK